MSIIKELGSIRGSSQGFMLLEMILAISIFYLLITLSWPWLNPNKSSANLDGYANKITTLLRNARILSIKNGHDVIANIDIGGKKIFINESDAIFLPEDIGVEILSSESCQISSFYFAIIFRPDGTNCGGVIRIWRGGRFFNIKINWLTGAIRAEGE